ncbi:hypothetical protein J2X68_003091 [Streptomyces sp. 3330]|nr:hypothetical protein [Streptomyces sp. 3330]
MLWEALWGLAAAGGTAMAGAVATDIWRSVRLRFTGLRGRGTPPWQLAAVARVQGGTVEPAGIEAGLAAAARGGSEPSESGPYDCEPSESGPTGTEPGGTEPGEVVRGGAGRLGHVVPEVAGARTAEGEPGRRALTRSSTDTGIRTSCSTRTATRTRTGTGTGSRTAGISVQHNVARDGGTQHITLSGDLNVGRESRGRR